MKRLTNKKAFQLAAELIIENKYKSKIGACDALSKIRYNHIKRHGTDLYSDLRIFLKSHFEFDAKLWSGQNAYWFREFTEENVELRAMALLFYGEMCE